MNYLPSIHFDDLPWSCEAEQSVLGALLIDNDAYNVVSPLLREETFWHPPHRAVFAVMQQLLRAGKPADVVTVFDALGSERAAFVGGLKYLNELAQCVPSARNVEQYAKIVGDKALRREILGAVDSALEVVQKTVSADEALDRVRTKCPGYPPAWRRWTRP
jgi:replicative DNA helicase